MLCKLLSQVDRSRFDMRVVSLLPKGKIGDELQTLQIPVSDVSVTSATDGFFALPALHRILLQASPHVLQGWMYHGNLAAWLGGKLLCRRVKVAWNIRHSLHGLSQEKRTTHLLIRGCAWLSGGVERILYNSETSRTQHELLGYAEKMAETIPNGFDTDIFQPDPAARITVREKLGLSADIPLVGLVARFDPLKDHETFLKAAAIVGKRQPYVNFVLVGRNVDHYNLEIRQWINQSDLQNRVHLLGERDDVPVLTAALDVAVSSSRSEAFPNAIGEAMSCGIPCVVTDVGDSSMLLGGWGRVVPSYNPSCLAEGIAELLCMMPDDRRALGKSARKRVIDNFSIASVVARYENLYTELAETS